MDTGVERVRNTGFGLLALKRQILEYGAHLDAVFGVIILAAFPLRLRGLLLPSYCCVSTASGLESQRTFLFTMRAG